MVRIGQIGAGPWGKNLLRTFSGLSGCVVKGVCEQNTKLLSALSNAHGYPIRTTTSYSDLLDDADIDAIVIATPPVTHAQFAMQALSRGKHVFVEKPLALGVDEAIQMIHLSRERQKVLMVGHLLLYHPAVRQLKSYIAEGQLGKIHYLYSTRVNLGRIREEENALWSLTAHDISVAMYLLDQAPVKVTATGSAYLRQNVEDVVFVTLYFNDNIMSHIHASWLDPHKVRKFTVVGSEKMAVFDDMENIEKIRLYDKGVSRQKSTGAYETALTLRHGDIYIPKIEMVEPLKLECRHFIDCITQNKKVFSDGENGLSVLKVLSAAQESLKSNGKPVNIKA